MGGDEQWLLTGQPLCFIVRSIQTKSINRKKNLPASPAQSHKPGEKKKKRKNWVRLLAVLVFSYLCIPPSSSFGVCVWKAWVSIPVPHSPLLLLHCWAVYQGQWAQGSLCVSPSCSAEKHILVDSRQPSEADRCQGLLNRVTFMILLSCVRLLLKHLF